MEQSFLHANKVHQHKHVDIRKLFFLWSYLSNTYNALMYEEKIKVEFVAIRAKIW